MNLEIIKVVIAMNDKVTRKILEKFFNSDNKIEIVGSVSDGAEALEIILKEKPDVFITDALLTQLDALAILTYLKRHNITTKSFVLLGASSDTLIQKLYNIGAHDILLKPFNMRVLLERIKEPITLLENVAANSMNISTNTSFISEDITKETEGNLDLLVENTIQYLGIPRSNKGFSYIKFAVSYTLTENPTALLKITRRLYPVIAKKFATTEACVERAIRHSIESAWLKNRDIMTKEIYRSTSITSKPSNSEFLLSVTDSLKSYINNAKAV